ncbi:MAG: type II secretion system protein [Elusimicrobia bacterium]|nr:type II secretion system protein [Elusimicrobiota bacterium]
MKIDLRKGGGFTLIELILVAAIIGLLASIAIPKFGNMIRKAKEAALKAILGSLRSALSIYYADNLQLCQWPMMGGSSPLVPKYIEKIPTGNIPYWHPNINNSDCLYYTVSDPNAVFNNYGFSYICDGGALIPHTFAYLVVNCTHPDASGRVWSTW